MLTIRKEQETILADSMLKTFTFKTLSFLEKYAPSWCEKRGDAEKIEFIDSLIAFAHKHHVFQEINIQKLILYKIEYDFPIPLSNFRHLKLCRESFCESYRIDHFLLTLISGRELIHITLDSDIEKLKEQHGIYSNDSK